MTFEKRLRLGKRLDRRAQKCIERQCRDKWTHHDFLSAMQHADQLTRKLNRLYCVYHCETCGCAHVGRASESDTVVWMMDCYSVNAGLNP